MGRTTINDIITEILRAEGWDTYTNYPEDRGGPTKWGITAKAWSSVLGRPATEDDVKAITEVGARLFYRGEYIVKPNFHQLPEELQELVIDCGVNHGTARAAKWLQKVVGVRADGVVGPKTLSAVRNQDWTVIYARICAHRVRFYGEIVRRDRTQAKFIGGWNNRAAKYIDRLAELLPRG
jgi:lysozyme family protein